jgi:hypothetical protein
MVIEIKIAGAYVRGSNQYLPFAAATS